MVARRTDFVTEPPMEDVRVVLGFARGERPGKRELALAWNNFESYGMNLFIGNSEDPTPMRVGTIGETNATMTMAKAEQMLVDSLPFEAEEEQPDALKQAPTAAVPQPIPAGGATPLQPSPAKTTGSGKTNPPPVAVRSTGPGGPKKMSEPVQPLTASGMLVLLEFLGPMILKWLAGR